MTERETGGLDPEVPAEDALEQRDPVGDEVPEDDPPADTLTEADPGDLAEQRRTVELDDDEYR